VPPTYRDDFRASTLRHLTRRLRRDATPEERTLWRHLQGRRFAEAKFRRQHQFGPYILDFLSAAHGLAIELDGGQHFEPDQAVADAARTAYLESRGIQVLRFTNLQVRQEIESVLQVVFERLGDAPSPYPLPEGEG
jgi:very-short-patch-repair endonuclease